ncbi:hypothetical protein GCM10027447_25540 [Glycomyces halotolerans]
MAKNWEGHLWEQQALDHVRELLPEVSGYWALQSFSFTSRTGRTRECDLFVATPGGLHLIEIKSHPGRAVNSGTTWYFERGKPVQNPQWLVEQKAKELKGLLEYRAQRAGKKLPRLFITASVFLSAPDLDCRFDEQQKHNVYGRQGVKTGLGEQGNVRWNPMGIPSGRTFQLVRGIRRVLLGEDAPVKLTRRAVGAIAEARERSSDRLGTDRLVIRRSGSEIRWWTWAGYRANLTL